MLSRSLRHCYSTRSVQCTLIKSNQYHTAHEQPSVNDHVDSPVAEVEPTPQIKKPLPNQDLIDKLAHFHEQELLHEPKNGYQTRAFRSAVGILSIYPAKIKSPEEAAQLRGIGPGILRRIKAIFEGQNYSPAKNNEETRRIADERLKIVIELQDIRGLGQRKAERLVEDGVTGLHDLWRRKYFEKLPAHQQFQLRCLDSLKKEPTDEEAESILQFVRDNVDAKFEVELTGPHRRKSTDPLDQIELLIRHPDHVFIPSPTHSPSTLAITSIKSWPNLKPYKRSFDPVDKKHNQLQDMVLSPLTERAMIASTERQSMYRWKGIALMPVEGRSRVQRMEDVREASGRYRRVWITFSPMKSWGSAVLCTTGDLEFTRHIREKAHRMGYYLNEFGLWRWQETPEQTQTKIPTQTPPVTPTNGGFWEKIDAGESEEEIFELLGMDYVHPEKRSYFNLFPRKKATSLKERNASVKRRLESEGL